LRLLWKLSLGLEPALLAHVSDVGDELVQDGGILVMLGELTDNRLNNVGFGLEK